MAQLESKHDAIKARGAHLLIISAQHEKSIIADVRGFVEKNHFSFPLLLDKNRAVSKAYGVYHRVGLDAFHIARPSAFVLDKAGKIKFLYVGSNQKDLVDLDELIGTI